MCGFVSYIGQNFNNKKIKTLFDKLSKINKHRGPDSTRSLHEKNYSIIFRRLSIIDLSNKSNQPFLSNDKKIKVIFNGEIYNYLEIKKALIKKGFKFNTSSDTEVILRLYELEGIKFIKQLKGMFSIILFDDNLSKTFLIRDHLGQKPLFYSKSKTNYIFSSEIKDILFLKNKLSEKIIENKKTVLKYLLRGWFNDTEETFYKQIYSFPAGSIGVISKNKLKITKYWNLDSSKKNKFFDKIKFKKKFLDNLKIHLRSDVPIAFTLSGGLDSSSLLGGALSLKYNNYKSFSLLTDKQTDERKEIKELIKVKKIKHEFCDIKKMYNNNLIQKIILHNSEPLYSMSFLNQYLLRKFIKKRGFKVLIVGEGGDEVLAGYKRMFIPYIYYLFKKKNKNIPKKFIYNLENNTGKKISFFIEQLKNYQNRKFVGNDIENCTPLDFYQKKLPKYLKFYNLVDLNNKNSFKKFMRNHLFNRDLPSILHSEDKISMNLSIESRSPFVEHDFVEYVYSHRWQYFMKNGNTKYMLRNIANSFVTKSYLNKKKLGRPNDCVHLMTKYYFKIFKTLIKKINIENFDNQKIISKFDLDIKKSNYQNFDFYFRVLNYLIWRKKIKFTN
tara:strand:+ start:108 stop:1943 length:1836 start_codon:yes stop_codon:yes gene_type:complete